MNTCLLGTLEFHQEETFFGNEIFFSKILSQSFKINKNLRFYFGSVFSTRSINNSEILDYLAILKNKKV